MMPRSPSPARIAPLRVTISSRSSCVSTATSLWWQRIGASNSMPGSRRTGSSQMVASMTSRLTFCRTPRQAGVVFTAAWVVVVGLLFGSMINNGHAAATLARAAFMATICFALWLAAPVIAYLLLRSVQPSAR